jgi:hypothetical protein
MASAIGLTAGGLTRFVIDASSGAATFTVPPLCGIAPTMGGQLVNKTYVDGRPAPTLANVLLSGNSAGATSINMNNQQITNGGDITSLTLFKAQGATPEFRLVDAGGTPAAGLAFTDATNLTELYCSDDLEIGPGGNTTINAGSGAFAFKNGGTDNFTVSGGGNTMRLNAPSGAQNFEMNTASDTQLSEIKFLYGTPGSGTAGFSMYRPVNTRSLAFYNYALAKQQFLLDANGTATYTTANNHTVGIDNSAVITLTNSTDANNGISINNTQNTSTAKGLINFNNSRAGGATLNNDRLAAIGVNGTNTSSGQSRAAFIAVVQDAAATATATPGRIEFRTNDTAGEQTRMVINSSGNIGMGTTVLTSKRLSIRGTGTQNGTIAFHRSDNDVPYVSCGYNQATDGFVIGVNLGASDITEYPFFVNRASSGQVGINTQTPDATYRMTIRNRSANTGSLACLSSSGNFGLVIFQGASDWSNGLWNGANAVLYVARDPATLRSINMAGTSNVNGADYAEYLEKDVVEEIVAKGDIVGIKSNGKLTKKWHEAKSFLIKTTNPGFVGGDGWSQALGMRPSPPAEGSEDYEAKKAEYDAALAEYQAKLEAERIKYDRMAYSGQVPVNVLGAKAGDYIVAAEGANNTITGIAVPEADISFAQYKKAVGRVIKMLEDGRAQVNVIVH